MNQERGIMSELELEEAELNMVGPLENLPNKDDNPRGSREQTMALSLNDYSTINFQNNFPFGLKEVEDERSENSSRNTAGNEAIQQSILGSNLDEGCSFMRTMEENEVGDNISQDVVFPSTASELGGEWSFQLPTNFGDVATGFSQHDVVLLPLQLKDTSSYHIEEEETGPPLKHKEKKEKVNRKLNVNPCPICERPYFVKKAPRRHIWTHYSAQEKEDAVARGEKDPSSSKKMFLCDQCPSAYTTNSELLKHRKQIHEEVVERQACEKCGSLVKNLAGHMRQSHPKKEDFRFVCLECEEKFINSARLRQHKLLKHGEGKKVKCERCEQLFKTRRELTVHVNSKHLKIMPYKCELCGVAFIWKTSWTRHIQGVHEGRKQRRRLSIK
ncbi:unnamed protein product [Orchesella dallaii]|uniref:C2H2-type domain-containing protein n=1 Tax=Orchesella dallaii TaxID=48710 RepID=A0ABP1PHY3_9HEXA